MCPRQQDWPSQAPIHRENKHSYHRSPVGGVSRWHWFSGLMKMLESRQALLYFAVLLPAVLVYFDPIVFAGNMFSLGSPLFGAFRTGGYVAILVGAVGAGTYLATERYSAWIGGVLAASGVTAWILGFVLAPISVLGIFFAGLGLLGFTPFMTSGVLVFHSMESMRRSQEPGRWLRFIAAFCAYFLFCFGMHGRANSAKATSLEDLRCGAPECVDSGMSRLRSWGPLVGHDDLVWAWHREPDIRIKAALAEGYQELTGEKIQERAWSLVD